MRVWHLLVLVPLVFVLAAIAIPVFWRQGPSRQDRCMGNLHTLCLVMRVYTMDHDDRLPDAGTWMDAVESYMTAKDVFHCPQDRAHKYSYAMNSDASGMNVAEVANRDAIIVVHESDIGRRNASAPLDHVTGTARHHGFVRVAFLGGDAQTVALREWPQLRLISATALQKSPPGPQAAVKQTAPAPPAPGD